MAAWLRRPRLRSKQNLIYPKREGENLVFPLAFCPERGILTHAIQPKKVVHMEKKPLLSRGPVVVGLAILCNMLWGSDTDLDTASN